MKILNFDLLACIFLILFVNSLLLVYSITHEESFSTAFVNFSIFLLNVLYLLHFRKCRYILIIIYIIYFIYW